jgi:fructose-1,6-bisphosphatase/inositol monophosphatase family enzyme
MKTRIITTVAVAGVLAALATSDVFAAGRGNGGSKGQSNGTCTSAQKATGTAATTRPVDSQRRDGTFLTTGTTANGATTR